MLMVPMVNILHRLGFIGTDEGPARQLDADDVLDDGKLLGSRLALAGLHPELPARRARVHSAEFRVPHDWVFLRSCGAGTSGFVKAFAVGSRQFAVKKVPDVFQCPTRALRVLREVTLLKHLTHPNIVALEGIYVEGPQFRDVYLKMELMTWTLERFIKVFSDGITELTLISIMFQASRGLLCMHSAGVLHRDIKPTNILVNGEDGLVKIAELGLSHVVASAAPSDETPPMTARAGSQYYRAPEMLLDVKHYSFPSDMWALGCVFAMCTTARDLFKGKDDLDQVRTILAALLPAPEDLDWMPSTARGFVNMLTDPAGNAGLERFKAEARQKVNENILQMILGLLKFNPTQRLKAKETTFHPCMSRFAPLLDSVTHSALRMPAVVGLSEKEARRIPPSMEQLALWGYRKKLLALRTAMEAPESCGAKTTGSGATSSGPSASDASGEPADSEEAEAQAEAAPATEVSLPRKP